MFDLKGWYLDKSKFCCQNVIVYNMDFYLFCVKDNKTYLYKDGHIGVAYFDSCGEEIFYNTEYSKGTLQEYVDSL